MNHRKMKLIRATMMLAGAAVLSAAVMLLWNWVMPGLLPGAGTLDYWHALGLLLLCRILLGGFHGRGGWHDHEHWQRWHAMTPAEREQFFQGRFGHCKPGWNQGRNPRRHPGWKQDDAGAQAGPDGKPGQHQDLHPDQGQA